jgi:hydroxymethylglutaryl-CoA reductase (NADPH)
MFGFLTSRWQSAGGSDKARPHWFDHHITPVLLSVAKQACTHPIHTIVTIALLASYSYLGVLDKGLLDTDTGKAGKVDFETLLAGSQRLRVGEETAWKWEAHEPNVHTKLEQVRTTSPASNPFVLTRSRLPKSSPSSPSSSPNRAIFAMHRP